LRKPIPFFSEPVGEEHRDFSDQGAERMAVMGPLQGKRLRVVGIKKSFNQFALFQKALAPRVSGIEPNGEHGRTILASPKEPHHVKP
jgi:hypothetical protein